MAINAGDIVWFIDADTGGLDAGVKKSLQSAKRLGVGLTAVGAAGAAALTGLVSKAQGFSKSMAEVNTLGVKDLEGLGDAVKDVAGEFALDLTDSVKGAYQAISSGASEAETPLVLESAARAATAGITDLTTSIELGTGVANAFGKSMADIDSVFDEAFIAVKGGVTTFEELGASVGKLSPLFSSVGLSSGEMFASIAALTKGGLATAEAVTGMKAALTGIIKPSADVAQFMKENKTVADELGFSFDVAGLKSQGLGVWMQNLQTLTGGNIETMAGLFGSVEGLAAVLALTGEQAGSFNELLLQMKDSTGASKEAFDAFVAANPGFVFEQLKSQMSVLAVELGTALLPSIIELAETIKPMVKQLIAWIKQNPEATKGLIKLAAAITATLLVIGPLLIALPAIGSVLAALPAILSAVGAAFVFFTGPVGWLVAAIIAAAALIVANWDFVKQRTIAIFTATSNFIGRIIDRIQDRIGGFIERVKQAIEFAIKLAKAIGESVGLPGFASGGVVGYATGGVVGGHNMVMVGERGPELAALPSGTRIMSNTSMRSLAANPDRIAGGGGGSFAPVINVSVDGSLTGSEIVDKIKTPLLQMMTGELRQAMR